MKKININPLFFIVVAVMYMTGNLYFFAVTFFSLFMHELVHLLFMCKNRIVADKITIEPFGISINADKPDYIPPFVFISAPVFNIITAFLFYICARFSYSTSMSFIVSSNLFLGLFNLLPILPFDGGRAIEAFLIKRKKSDLGVLKAISVICGCFLVGLGLAFLKITQYNFSICVIGIFIIFNAICENEVYSLKSGKRILKKSYYQNEIKASRSISVPYSYPAHKLLKEFRGDNYYIVNVIKSGIITKTVTETQIIEKVINSNRNLQMWEI